MPAQENSFLSRTLNEYLRIFEKELHALARGRDSETIHRFRVASRRLRTALSVFQCVLSRRAVKRWRNRIRALSRAWGEVRDSDVETDFLTTVLKQSEARELKETTIDLLGRLKRRRRTLEKRAARAVAQFRKTGTLVEIRRALQACSARPGSRDHEKVFKRARKKVDTCRQEVISYERDVHHPKRYRKLHALRIAVKRLRYTTEIFSPLYAHTMDEVISVSRKMQDSLGAMHDLYVWRKNLPVSRGSTGMRLLKELLKRERLHAYKKFLKQWEKTKKRNVWEALGIVGNTRQAGR